jgi:general stress protein 26
MTDTSFAQFIEQLKKFNTAHVVTRADDDSLLARPMAIAEITGDGHLWFITHVESSAIRDITEHPQIAACLQSGGRYLSISGLAKTSRDRSRIEQLWDPRQAVWFEKGIQDPSLILLEIVPMAGEFWDRSGIRGIDFRIREVGALITGSRLEDDAGAHGQINFDNGQN